MTQFINNDVASGAIVYASDHNDQGAAIAAVLNGNIDADNLANGAVNSDKIADGSITPSDIAVLDKCRVYRATDTTHTSNGSWQAVAFVSESFDTNSLHDNSTNPSRLTVPATGYYMIFAQIQFASNATGNRGLRFRKNGATNSGLGGGNFMPAISGASARINIHSGPVSLTAGDYVEIEAFQSSGGSLAIEANTVEYELGTWFSITRIL